MTRSPETKDRRRVAAALGAVLATVLGSLACSPLTFETHEVVAIPLLCRGEPVVRYGVSRLSQKSFSHYADGSGGARYEGRAFVDTRKGKRTVRTWATTLALKVSPYPPRGTILLDGDQPVEFSGTFLSPAELRAIRPRIVRELSEFRPPTLPADSRADELADGRVLWTLRDPRNGHYASLWPNAAALRAWLTRPPEPRILGPITVARSLGIGAGDLAPGAIEASRRALAETLGRPAASLDYSRASLALLRRGRDGKPLVWPRERLQALLLLYFGESVRRATGGQWVSEATDHGPRITVRSRSGRSLEVFGDATGLWDDGENPEWDWIFDRLVRPEITLGG